MISLLTFILGLLVGYWAKEVFVMLKGLYDERIEAIAARNVGVVRPQVSKVTKSRPMDDSNTGPVMRPSPDQIIIENMKERDRQLRINHQ